MSRLAYIFIFNFYFYFFLDWANFTLILKLNFHLNICKGTSCQGSRVGCKFSYAKEPSTSCKYKLHHPISKFSIFLINSLIFISSHQSKSIIYYDHHCLQAYPKVYANVSPYSEEYHEPTGKGRHTIWELLFIWTSRQRSIKLPSTSGLHSSCLYQHKSTIRVKHSRDNWP